MLESCAIEVLSLETVQIAEYFQSLEEHGRNAAEELKRLVGDKKAHQLNKHAWSVHMKGWWGCIFRYTTHFRTSLTDLIGLYERMLLFLTEGKAATMMAESPGGAQRCAQLAKKANEVLQLLGAVHDIAVSVRDQAKKYAGEQAVTVQDPDREPEREILNRVVSERARRGSQLMSDAVQSIEAKGSKEIKGLHDQLAKLEHTTDALQALSVVEKMYGTAVWCSCDILGPAWRQLNESLEETLTMVDSAPVDGLSMKDRVQYSHSITKVLNKCRTGGEAMASLLKLRSRTLTPWAPVFRSTLGDGDGEAQPQSATGPTARAAAVKVVIAKKDARPKAPPTGPVATSRLVKQQYEK